MSTASSFEEAERCKNLSFEDIDQTADRLTTAAEAINLIISAIVLLSFASPWVDPRGIRGNPQESRGNGTGLVFPLSPWGREIVLFWKRLPWITGTYPRDLFDFWSVAYRSRPKFFSRHFISFRCQISILCCGCPYVPLGKGYLSLILCPLPRGLERFLFLFFCSGDNEDFTDVTSILNLTVITVGDLDAQRQKYIEIKCHDFEDYRWLRVPAWLWHMPRICHAPPPSLRRG